jgi:(2Fe-2S) ferredoxin
MDELPLDQKIAAGFLKIGLAEAQRHVFLCAGPDCCGADAGQATWETLKREIKDLSTPILRTKAACFRLCAGGPWLVVYPEGIWYGGVTPERCARIVKEHLKEGNPVAEWVVRQRSFDAMRLTSQTELEGKDFAAP